MFMKTTRASAPNTTATPFSLVDVLDLLAQPCACHPTSPRHTPFGPGDHDPQVSVRALGPLLAYVRARTKDHWILFDHLGALGEDDFVAMTTANEWLDEASRWLREPGLGVEALSCAERGCGDVLEFACDCAPTLRDALLVIVHFAHLSWEAARFHLHIDARIAVLCLDYSVPVSEVAADFALAALARALRRWLGKASGVEFWLAHSPRRSAVDYALHFAPWRCRFGTASDAVAFAPELLDTPLPGADLPRYQALMRCAERNSAALPKLAHSATAQVRRRLLAAMGAQEMTARGIARGIAVHPRALSRRLHDEGTSFSSLLDEVRRARAVHLAQHTNTPSRVMAKSLGYTNTATFCRAFQRWTGRSPMRYRREANGQSAVDQQKVPYAAPSQRDSDT